MPAKMPASVRGTRALRMMVLSEPLAAPCRLSQTVWKGMALEPSIRLAMMHSSNSAVPIPNPAMRLKPLA